MSKFGAVFSILGLVVVPTAILVLVQSCSSREHVIEAPSAPSVNVFAPSNIVDDLDAGVRCYYVYRYNDSALSCVKVR